MKKSEKLLDAIGQIDDKIVQEAANSGKAESVISAVKAPVRKGKPVKSKKSAGRKRIVYRWQGALAACAVLLICVGIYGMLDRSGLLYRVGTKNDTTAQQPEEGFEMAGAAADEAMPEADAVPEMENERAEEAFDTGASAQGGDRGASAELGAEKGSADAGDSLSVEQKFGSGANRTAELAEEAAPDETENAANAAVRAVVKQSSAQKIDFEIENGLDSRIIYGRPYSLERRTDNGWEQVEPAMEIAWKQDLLYVEPGGTCEEAADLSFYGSLPAGQYRLVKSYQVERWKEPEGSENYPLYVEFEIEE